MDEGLYYIKLFRACRREWSRGFPARRQCFDVAKVIPTINKGGLTKWKCAHCNNMFAYSETQCDHIIPIANTRPINQDEFWVCFEKLHIGVNGLQILCKSCHNKKGKQDTHKLKKIKFIEIVKNFISQHADWFPPDFNINENDADMLLLRKLYAAINRINKESADERKLEKHKKKMLKLIGIR